jgi:hypothetical protein
MLPKHAILIVFAATFFIGCTNTYGLNHQREGGAIPRSASVYVAMPEPGRYVRQQYPNSGAQTQAAIISALKPHVAKVQAGGAPEEDDATLVSARAAGASHAVVPKIKHWEERATEWSGRPDRITIDIRIFDVASGEVVDAAEVSGKSRWLTFGGDHPQDLLPRAVGDYFAAVFP